MSDNVDKADELPLISYERPMARCDSLTEKGDQVPLLDKHDAKPVGRGITLDDEALREVRHGEDRGRGDGDLELIERRCRCLILRESHPS